MALDKVIDSAKLEGAITATADAIREKAGITDKLEWNQETGFAEAVSAISVDSSRIILLKEQQFSGFVVDPTFGAYSPGYVAPALFKLENGKTYHVVWDGTEYECVAYVYEYSGISIVAIGNGSSLGLPSNGEPFLITYNAPFDNTQMFSTEATDSHTVGIWQESESGGGDCADIRYVTFMNDDGTVELGKKAVAVGDDCADPIARGVFSTPTKPSTAQYNYTFSGGWATTPGGGKDSNALKAVNENKTVYANFIAAVRYYTITYYDSDGTTVLKTESLAYGTTPSYTPTKQNYAFTGWTPVLVSVTGNASYTASWTSVITFNNATWTQIAEISASGKAQETFALGDTKTLTLTKDDGTTINVRVKIAAFNWDYRPNGKGKAPITVVCDQVITGINFKNRTANFYKWSTDFVRTALNSGLVYNMLPSELRSYIKTVTKETAAGLDSNNPAPGVAGPTETTSDMVWLLSAEEVGLTSQHVSNENYAPTYPIFKNNTSRILKRVGTTTNNEWYLRSGHHEYGSNIAAVTTSGTLSKGGFISSSNATVNPLVFGFCI